MKVRFHVVVQSPRSLAYAPLSFYREFDLAHPPVVGVEYNCILWTATPMSVSYDIDSNLWEAWCGCIEVPESEIECKELINEGWIKEV